MKKSKKIKRWEERLSNAYDAGFFDGYHEGVEVTHDIWVTQLLSVKGIGPVMKERIMAHMTDVMRERQKKANLRKNELAEEVNKLGSC